MKRKRFRLHNVSIVSNSVEGSNPIKNAGLSNISDISRGKNKKDIFEHNAQTIIQIKKPYIKNGSELIIPCNCQDKYRWWAGGQSIYQTLLELNAPDRAIEQYIDPILTPQAYEDWTSRSKNDASKAAASCAE